MAKILYLHQYYCPKGGFGNNRSAEFAEYWTKAGISVTVVTSVAQFPANHEARKHSVYLFNENGVSIVVLNIDYQHEFPFYKRIFSWIHFLYSAYDYCKKLQKPDIIYASSTPLTIGELGLQLSEYWNVPFVFECVDVWPDVPIGMGILRNPLLIHWIQNRTNLYYRRAKFIIALSEGMKTQIVSHQIPENKVFVIPNGTNTEQFLPSSSYPPPYRVGIYAGTIGIANDVSAILDAMEWIQKEKPESNLQVIIVGKGNDLCRIQKRLQQKPIRNLTLLPPVPKAEIQTILSKAAFGIVSFAGYPVLEANSANKWFDYLAMGLPIVQNYEGWQAKYLREFKCGLASPQKNIPMFAHCLLQMETYSDSELISMSQNARKLSLLFDRKRLAQKIIQILFNFN
ncbi:MAG: glycosyltransferase family 4 protein [Bacteroidia bacterium]|nr:glycosyltransferase family 4 protein [Bacteroidia bacterium]